MIDSVRAFLEAFSPAALRWTIVALVMGGCYLAGKVSDRFIAHDAEFVKVYRELQTQRETDAQAAATLRADLKLLAEVSRRQERRVAALEYKVLGVPVPSATAP